ncbi:MAG: hypothetical protein ACFE8J_17710 [Candidatus Heimdallarchaeota archaeon]
MKMRPSRVFRWIVRMFLFLLTLSMTVVSILGCLSAVMILGNMNENIKIPAGPPSANFDITNPSSMNITIPFNITNAGYFDLTSLIIDVKISMTFGNASTPTNETTNAVVFDKAQIFPNIIRGQTYSGVFFGNSSDFIEANFPNATTEIDWFRTPALEFSGNFTLSAYYSLDLIAFTFGINNVTLGTIP